MLMLLNLVRVNENQMTFKYIFSWSSTDVPIRIFLHSLMLNSSVTYMFVNEISINICKNWIKKSFHFFDMMDIL